MHAVFVHTVSVDTRGRKLHVPGVKISAIQVASRTPSALHFDACTQGCVRACRTTRHNRRLLPTGHTYARHVQHVNDWHAFKLPMPASSGSAVLKGGGVGVGHTHAMHSSQQPTPNLLGDRSITAFTILGCASHTNSKSRTKCTAPALGLKSARDHHCKSAAFASTEAPKHQHEMPTVEASSTC